MAMSAPTVTITLVGSGNWIGDTGLCEYAQVWIHQPRWKYPHEAWFGPFEDACLVAAWIAAGREGIHPLVEARRTLKPYYAISSTNVLRGWQIVADGDDYRTVECEARERIGSNSNRDAETLNRNLRIVTAAQARRNYGIDPAGPDLDHH